MWDRGVRDPVFRGHQAGRWVLVGATMAAAAVLVVLAARESAPLSTGFRAGPATDTEQPAATPQDTPAPGDRTYTLDGGDPGAFPDERTGLAFMELDDTLGTAQGEFGPAHAYRPDINETLASIWHLPGDAEFVVVAAGEGPDDPVVALSAAVPPGSGVRVGAYGGVVVGRSTAAEVAQAWGAGYDRSAHPGDDFVLRYVLCAGPWPVVVKFDHYEGAGSWDDDPIGRVLIAYTDDDPATAGCPAA